MCLPSQQGAGLPAQPAGSCPPRGPLRPFSHPPRSVALAPYELFRWAFCSPLTPLPLPLWDLPPPPLLSGWPLTEAPKGPSCLPASCPLPVHSHEAARVSPRITELASTPSGLSRRAPGTRPLHLILTLQPLQVWPQRPFHFLLCPSHTKLLSILSPRCLV